MTISAGKFKAICLKLMDEVNEFHEEVVITKHGKPVAKLIPVGKEAKPLFGFLKDSIVIKGDIVGPIGVQWNANE